MILPGTELQGEVKVSIIEERNDHPPFFSF